MNYKHKYIKYKTKYTMLAGGEFKLNFIVDEYFLCQQALTKRPVRDKKTGKVKLLALTSDLKNKLWDKYTRAYRFLYGNRGFINTKFINNLHDVIDEIKSLFKECIETDEFKQLYKETVEYMDKLEEEWKSKKDEILKTLYDISRVNVPKETFNIYVVHPRKIYGGRNMGNNNIAWGHWDEWPNYTMVYLMHEVYHSVLGKGDIPHSIIQLATDNELRIRLNKGGEYFKCKGNNVGHRRLREIEKKLLPDWGEFLKSTETILEFEKRMLKKYSGVKIKRMKGSGKQLFPLISFPEHEIPQYKKRLDEGKEIHTHIEYIKNMVNMS